jgi:23S rRNA pseudouridine1911/1915/1917 synthase
MKGRPPHAMTLPAPFIVPAEEAGHTLAAVLRARMPGQSWTQVRALVAARKVRVLDDLCLDPARRLKEGDAVEVLGRPARPAGEPETIVVRYLDDHLVVVEKPSGLCTVRHPSERAWKAERKSLTPTLEDLVPKLIARREGTRGGPRPRVVQRLDKETSGLVVFGRTVTGERGLGMQFRRHTVIRRYLAVVPGKVNDQRIHTFLARDRGDGRRGTTLLEGIGKEAITHVEVRERLKGYTVVACRLETGRTHQIRIHLAEKGHPVCGDKVYCLRRDGKIFADDSGATRLALHATELGFIHPITGVAMRWEMPLPPDMQGLIDRLRNEISHR